jgi:hypothetical protein
MTKTDHIGQITINLYQDREGNLIGINYSADWIGKDGKPAKPPIIGDLTDRLAHDSLFNLGMEIAKIRDQIAREIPPF